MAESSAESDADGVIGFINMTHNFKLYFYLIIVLDIPAIWWKIGFIDCMSTIRYF